MADTFEEYQKTLRLDLKLERMIWNPKEMTMPLATKDIKVNPNV